MITTKDGLKIEMVELLDDLGDSPTWGEWTCNVLLPDGKWLENCSVQGDEHDIARETLTDEDGNEL